VRGRINSNCKKEPAHKTNQEKKAPRRKIGDLKGLSHGAWERGNGRGKENVQKDEGWREGPQATTSINFHFRGQAEKKKKDFVWFWGQKRKKGSFIPMEAPSGRGQGEGEWFLK